MQQLNKKIINNAISAYLWLAILLLLVKSKNSNINNPFVKKHAKTALFIHSLFFLIYIIFIAYWFLNIGFNLFGITFLLNHILAIISFCFLFFLLIVWCIKSYNWKEFFIIDIFSISKTDKLFENKNIELTEKQSTTIVLSLIPIIWLLIPWLFKWKQSKIIENNFKINIIFTLFITFLFIYWRSDLFLIFMLLYIIWIVYFSIQIFINKKILIFNIDFIPNFRELYLKIQILFTYIKNFFSKDSFKSLNDTKNLINSNFIDNQKKDEELITKLKNPKISDKIFFIPIFNIISLIDINSKNKFLILNWIRLTLFSILLFIFLGEKYLIFSIFISIFLFWQRKNLIYKLPFLYEITHFLYKIVLKILGFIKKLKQIKKDNKEVRFKTYWWLYKEDTEKANVQDKTNI